MRSRKSCIRPNEVSKKLFLEQFLVRHRELGRRQREYKKILSTKKSRTETILEASRRNTIEHLRSEKNNLRSQIWVATGATHERDNTRCLDNIQCHVKCQEHLADDIHKLKVHVSNLEREVSRVDKQVYDLNRRTVPESQHQAYVARTRKKLIYLENQLEVGMRRECVFTSMNASLREELISVLHHRTFFNDSYSKLVQKLNSDKKYLIELIEYSLGTFENCIEIYEKIDSNMKKEHKEQDLRKVEAQDILRRTSAKADIQQFLDTKGQCRKLADLQPKEYQRREKFRKKHNKKINLYNSVLDKILAYSHSAHISSVIKKYQEQESLYYSYYQYANEMSYHMTILNNAVNSLYEDISHLKQKNRSTLTEQLEVIETLENTLKDKRANNDHLQKLRNSNNERLENFLQGFESLFELANANSEPLMLLLGDHTHINLINVRHFLKILEKRIINIVACVYVMEREDKSIKYSEYCLEQIEKIHDPPTPLNEIVLTQQCAECAETAFIVDDARKEGVIVQTVDQAKKILHDKVKQPEMQYLLHNISQCRLPRSRLLAAKRNM